MEKTTTSRCRPNEAISLGESGDANTPLMQRHHRTGYKALCAKCSNLEMMGCHIMATYMYYVLVDVGDPSNSSPGLRYHHQRIDQLMS